MWWQPAVWHQQLIKIRLSVTFLFIYLFFIRSILTANLTPSLFISRTFNEIHLDLSDTVHTSPGGSSTVVSLSGESNKSAQPSLKWFWWALPGESRTKQYRRLSNQLVLSRNATKQRSGDTERLKGGPLHFLFGGVFVQRNATCTQRNTNKCLEFREKNK